jgi:outer membrane protein assembly factor BamA
VHGPSVRDDEAQVEVVREIRVHGNATVGDEDIIKLAGLTLGQELPPGAIESVEQRLKQSGKFETVEVRKRYRSLTDPSDIAIVLLVHERPGTTSVSGVLRRPSRPFGRINDRLMFLPIVNYSDGYGFTYGGLLSAKDTLGLGERISVPLTWGGTRRAALEIDRTFKSGPLTRAESSIAIWQRENPHFDIDDRRVELKGRAERRIARLLRLGAQASKSSIDFGAVDDDLWTFGTDALVDTRSDPTFPRNAFVLGAGWNGLHFRSQPTRIDRYNTDARGYVGIIGQAIGAARVQYTRASAHLPDYERILLGGASTLRGFRTGTFDGDRTLVTSAEVRVPITSVLSSARLGVMAFFDAAKAWDFGSRFEDARWHRGLGGGVFLIAPLIKLNLDVAHGLTDGDTRVHLAAGFAF